MGSPSRCACMHDVSFLILQSIGVHVCRHEFECICIYVCTYVGAYMRMHACIFVACMYV